MKKIFIQNCTCNLPNFSLNPVISHTQPHTSMADVLMLANAHKPWHQVTILTSWPVSQVSAAAIIPYLAKQKNGIKNEQV